MGRDTALAVENRRIEIMNLMLSGVTHSDLVVYYKNNYPDKSEKTLHLDITWAYNELKKYSLRNIEQVIDRHVMLYDKIAAECMNDPYNKATAIKALQAKEKLLKMHSPDTAIQINNNNLDLSHLTVEQLEKLLNGKSNEGTDTISS